MKPLYVALCSILACGGSRTVATPTPPATAPTEVPIWPSDAPDAQSVATSENAMETVTAPLVAGRSWTRESNVARPTMTVHPPKGTDSGVAVVVFPGGGYKILAVDLEGTEICDWLTSIGVTCVLLKYRVPDSGPHWDDNCECEVTPAVPRALQDAQRTLGLLRARAAEWRLDPHKIGVLGFSAGGHLAAAVSTHFEQRAYAAIDAADRESCRPDFAVAIYPGHLLSRGTEFTLNPDIATHITPRTSPTFLLQAEDDPVDDVRHALVYYAALKASGVPVEMHLFAEGGHAFGLRRTRFPITAWPTLVERWWRTSGVLSD
ncbi:MAG: alpha/beta hydrolase [Polyangiales bacterium]